MVTYDLYDKISNKILGRMYIDLVFNNNKKISSPISMKLLDKINNTTNDINNNNNTYTYAEIALLANYVISKDSQDKNVVMLTYDEIILLFREFGYILSAI